jgi:hypothetical protein
VIQNCVIGGKIDDPLKNVAGDKNLFVDELDFDAQFVPQGDRLKGVGYRPTQPVR